MKLGIEELSIIVEGLRLRVKQLSNSVTEINQSLETEVGSKAPAIMQTTSPAGIASFADGGEDMPIKSLKCTIVPVQAGTGDPAPDNVRPITGRDSVTVVRCGKNWFDESNAQNVLADSRYCKWENGKLHFKNDGSQYCYSKAFDIVLPPGTYTLRLKNYTLVSGVPPIWMIKVGDASVIYPNTTSLYTFTVSVTTTVQIRLSTSGTTAASEFYANVLLERGSSSTDYEPYTSVTHSIPFPQTVYGGWVDVIKGVLHVTHEQITSYNGETLPGAWISDRDVYAAGTTPTTGAQVVYELASEQIIPVDPVTINTLLGNNNIYCNTGTVEVEYAADTKMYIDNAVAAVTPEPEPSPEPEQDEVPQEEEEEEEAEPAPEEDTAEPAEAVEEEAEPVVKKTTRKK